MLSFCLPTRSHGSPNIFAQNIFICTASNYNNNGYTSSGNFQISPIPEGFLLPYFCELLFFKYLSDIAYTRISFAAKNLCMYGLLKIEMNLWILPLPYISHQQYYCFFQIRLNCYRIMLYILKLCMFPYDVQNKLTSQYII